MTIKDDLQQAYLFHKLPDPDLEKCASAAREMTCEPGKFIYKKGGRGHGGSFPTSCFSLELRQLPRLEQIKQLERFFL